MNKREVLQWLEKRGSRRVAEGMSRYGIETKLRVFGVSMGSLLTLSKKIGKDHELAEQLWTSGCYEARLLAALVGEPERLTRRQMNAWAADFENWADCDTVCFKLFDQSPFAWGLAAKWAKSSREFVKRGGFALMACLALHDKGAADRKFLVFLPLIESGARDERNFVMKGVSWTLRAIGRRNPALHSDAVGLATRLAKSKDASCRWVGKDALRDLARLKSKAMLPKARPPRRAKRSASTCA